jgi:hypothetical protein
LIFQTKRTSNNYVCSFEFFCSFSTLLLKVDYSIISSNLHLCNITVDVTLIISLFKIYRILTLIISLFKIYRILTLIISLFKIYRILTLIISLFKIYRILTLIISLFKIYRILTFSCDFICFKILSFVKFILKRSKILYIIYFL